MNRRRLLQLGAASLLAAPITKSLASSSTPLSVKKNHHNVKALLFDVFGTVVNWHSSIIAAGEALSIKNNISVDWQKFAELWAYGYIDAIKKIREHKRPWITVEEIFKERFHQLTKQFNLNKVNKQDLDTFSETWYHLTPWPDTIAGLNLLRSQYIIAPLSNANIALMLKLSKNTALPWDCILSAELSGHYKPDKAVYLNAAHLLRLPPSEIMMVAAHPYDLMGAKRAGFRTALVNRPLEHGAWSMEHPKLLKK